MNASLSSFARALRRGDLVAFPTETVYGLGANAFDSRAVARVFSMKGRPAFDPLIVHVASIKQAMALWQTTPPLARRLMKRFWPGPLTLVLPKSDRVPDIVTGGLPAVGVRMPAHPVALALIRKAGVPIAAPSANRFTRPSPTTAAAVRDEFGKKGPRIIDGGPCRIGVESTVVALVKNQLLLLRPGGITAEELRRFTKKTLLRPRRGSRQASPGLLERHYAPRTPLYVLTKGMLRGNVDRKLPLHRVAGMSWKSSSLDQRTAFWQTLSSTGNLTEAASRFFQTVRELDARRFPALLAMPFPKKGLGLALADRLERAAVGTAVIKGDHVFLKHTKKEKHNGI